MSLFEEFDDIDDLDLEDNITVDVDDDMNWNTESNYWEQTFIEDGREFKWITKVASIEGPDAEGWNTTWETWKAQDVDTKEEVYFVLDTGNEFMPSIDWGPEDSEDAALEFMRGKENSLEYDDFEEDEIKFPEDVEESLNESKSDTFELDIIIEDDAPEIEHSELLKDFKAYNLENLGEKEFSDVVKYLLKGSKKDVRSLASKLRKYGRTIEVKDPSDFDLADYWDLDESLNESLEHNFKIDGFEESIDSTFDDDGVKGHNITYSKNGNPIVTVEVWEESAPVSVVDNLIVRNLFNPVYDSFEEFAKDLEHKYNRYVAKEESLNESSVTECNKLVEDKKHNSFEEAEESVMSKGFDYCKDIDKFSIYYNKETDEWKAIGIDCGCEKDITPEQAAGKETIEEAITTDGKNIKGEFSLDNNTFVDEHGEEHHVNDGGEVIVEEAGKDISYRVYKEDECISVFEDKEDAINFAEKHDADNVVQVVDDYTEVIWDASEGFDECLTEDLEKIEDVKAFVATACENCKFFTDDKGKQPVLEFISQQENKMKSKICYDIVKLNELKNQARSPLSKYLGDGIFELRTKVGTNSSRCLYFFVFGGDIVFTNAFKKDQQKTPSNEIDLAKKRRDIYITKELEQEV